MIEDRTSEQLFRHPVRIFYTDQTVPLTIPVDTDLAGEELLPNYILLAEENGTLAVTVYTEGKLLRTFALSMKSLELFYTDPFTPTLYDKEDQVFKDPDLDIILLENDRDLIQQAQIEAWEYPLLSDMGETVLLMRMAAGDHTAYERLYRSNMRLVWKYARLYYWNIRGMGFYEPYLDILQAGYLGLMRTLTKFDISKPGKRTPIGKVSTYAHFWCRRMIANYLKGFTHPIKIPRGEIAFRKQVFTAIQLLTEAGLPCTTEDIAYELIPQGLSDGETLMEYERLYRRVQEALNCGIVLSVDELDKEDSDNGNTATGYDSIPDPRPGPDEVIQIRQLRAEALEVINRLKLSPRDLKIMLMWLGFWDGYPYLKSEIGRRSGLTRARVSSIILENLGRLRQTPHSRKLRAWLQ
ncbi:MAG: sigma-70 family RNA polymerase sigma factor [Patescibacteria group bacterium]|nr:sigma-70 family RNA polymerase sigma factor [Patescibacteria group bacterium]